MRHNHNHDNAPGLQLVPVRFEFTHPTASIVCIAGTFNQWQPETKALHPDGDGHWWKETALAPGSYEYCLVVDGQWMPDPLAKDFVPNPFGGINSIVTVTAPTKATHVAAVDDLTLKIKNKPKTKKI